MAETKSANIRARSPRLHYLVATPLLFMGPALILAGQLVSSYGWLGLAPAVIAFGLGLHIGDSLLRLVREAESLRSELNRTRSRLKDLESRLPQCTQAPQ